MSRILNTPRNLLYGFFSVFTRRGSAVASEIIGGAQRIIRYTQVVGSSIAATRDVGTTDYAFYDRARHGKARGLEISGLLLKPLYSKISAWKIGRPPTFTTGVAESDIALTEWWRNNHAKVRRTDRESTALGDSYLVINADLTCTLLPPNVVTPITDEADFSKVIGWKVVENYPRPGYPSQRQQRIDEYYADRRVTKIGNAEAKVYPNPIKRIPLIHVPNANGTDEMFGRSEGEALIPLLQKYGEVIEAAIAGNKRQGRPTPSISKFSTFEELQKFWDMFIKRSRPITLPDGTTQTEEYFEFDADKIVLLSGGAEFDWKQPGSFMGDVEKLLGLLFYLYVQHTEMPEWVLGNAIASSKASAETQVEPLVKFIESKQSDAESWVLELCEIVLTYINVFDVKVKVVRPNIKWPNITNEDGQLTLETLRWAKTEGLIDDLTALSLAPIDIDNPKEVLDKARLEMEEKEQDFEDEVARRIEAQDQPNRDAAEDDTLPEDSDAETDPDAAMRRSSVIALAG